MMELGCSNAAISLKIAIECKFLAPKWQDIVLVLNCVSNVPIFVPNVLERNNWNIRKNRKTI